MRNWKPGRGRVLLASNVEAVVPRAVILDASSAISALGRLKYCKYSGPRRDAIFHPKNLVGLLLGIVRIPGIGVLEGRIIKPAASAGRAPMEKFTTFEVPPPGAGLDIEISTVPAAAMSASGITAFSRVGVWTEVCRV